MNPYCGYHTYYYGYGFYWYYYYYYYVYCQSVAPLGANYRRVFIEDGSPPFVGSNL